MEIKKICVLGAGLMGNGITQVCAQAGYQVSMRDIEQRFIDGGMNTIRKESGPGCGEREKDPGGYGRHPRTNSPYPRHERGRLGRRCGR